MQKNSYVLRKCREPDCDNDYITCNDVSESNDFCSIHIQMGEEMREYNRIQHMESNVEINNNSFVPSKSISEKNEGISNNTYKHDIQDPANSKDNFSADASLIQMRRPSDKKPNNPKEIWGRIFKKKTDCANEFHLFEGPCFDFTKPIKCRAELKYETIDASYDLYLVIGTFKNIGGNETIYEAKISHMEPPPKRDYIIDVFKYSMVDLRRDTSFEMLFDILLNISGEDQRYQDICKGYNSQWYGNELKVYDYLTYISSDKNQLIGLKREIEKYDSSYNPQISELLKIWSNHKKRFLIHVGEVHNFSHVDVDGMHRDFMLNPFVNSKTKDILKCVKVCDKMKRKYTKEQLQWGQIKRYIDHEMKQGRNACVPRKDISERYHIFEKTYEQYYEEYGIVQDYENVYLKYPHDCESYISDLIDRIIPGECKIVSKEISFDDIEDECQINAVRGALSNNFSIITGGAGTGKTRVIICIIKNLVRMRIPVIATSFTGKAVEKVRRELIKEGLYKVPCKTMHSLIFVSTSKKSTSEKSTSEEPTYLVVDEASMINTALMYEFVRAYPSIKHFLLVGDPHQLGPIKWGKLFEKLIITEKIPIFELITNFRVIETSDGSSGNLILSNSTKIIECVDNEMPFEFDCSDDSFNTKDGDYIDNLLTDIKETLGYTNRSFSDDDKNQESFFGHTPGAKSIMDMIIICRTNVDANALNKKCQNLYKDPKSSPDDGAWVDHLRNIWYRGDKVIMKKNDNQRNIMNGSIGIVMDIMYGESKTYLVVNFDGTLYHYDLHPPRKNQKTPEKDVNDNNTDGQKDPNDNTNDNDKDEGKRNKNKKSGSNINSIDNLSLGYAITCHKSQGSEWDLVVFYDSKNNYYNTYNLMYTAITRARRKVYIVGTIESIEESCVRRPPNRHDSLDIMLAEKLKGSALYESSYSKFHEKNFEEYIGHNMLPLGKHKGKLYIDVYKEESDYCRWIVEECSSKSVWIQVFKKWIIERNNLKKIGML